MIQRYNCTGHRSYGITQEASDGPFVKYNDAQNEFNNLIIEREEQRDRANKLEQENARLKRRWSGLKDEVCLQMKANEFGGGEFNDAANIAFEQVLEEMAHLEQATKGE